MAVSKGRAKPVIKATKAKLVKAKVAKPKRETTPVKVPKLVAPQTPFRKTELFSALSEQSGVQKKEIGRVLEALNKVIQVHLGKAGPGQFVLPGLIKMTLVHKAATKARKGTNPFTGEETVFKAKPARKLVKVKPLKVLKGMV